MDVVMSAESTPHSELRSYIERGANRKYLAEFDSLVEQFDTERRRSAELRLRFRRTLRDEGWRDEDIEELLVEAERASNPARRPDG